MQFPAWNYLVTPSSGDSVCCCRVAQCMSVARAHANSLCGFLPASANKKLVSSPLLHGRSLYGVAAIRWIPLLETSCQQRMKRSGSVVKFGGLTIWWDGQYNTRVINTTDTNTGTWLLTNLSPKNMDTSLCLNKNQILQSISPYLKHYFLPLTKNAP